MMNEDDIDLIMLYRYGMCNRVVYQFTKLTNHLYICLFVQMDYICVSLCVLMNNKLFIYLFIHFLLFCFCFRRKKESSKHSAKCLFCNLICCVHKKSFVLFHDVVKSREWNWYSSLVYVKKKS